MILSYTSFVNVDLLFKKTIVTVLSINWERKYMKISIVLSTYNGSKYIEKQLESIRSQSLVADEVIISDDCSTDTTVEIIQNFIHKYKLKSWRLYKNKVNKGWERNFKEILQLAIGDIIFPCDQDDVWNSNKLEIMSGIMQNNEKILLLVSDYKIFYNDRQVASIAPPLRYGPVKKLGFDKNFLNVRYPGCVYCIRKDLLKYYEKYSWVKYPHDAFLWRVSALLDGLYYVDFVSILYRRHTHTATGHEKRTVDYKINNLRYYNKVIEVALDFLKNEKVLFQSEKESVLHKYNKWCALRMDFLAHHKIKSGIKLLKYIDCYYSKKTYVFDLMAVIFPKAYNWIVNRAAEI